MKKFIFKLETLLALRLSRERLYKRELEQVRLKWGQAKEQEIMLNSQTTDLLVEIQKRRSSGLLDMHETYSQILEHLNQTLFQVRHTLTLLEQQIESQKCRLKEAIQERKVIEKIKEKHYASWRLREARSEGALLDEIAFKKSGDVQRGGSF